MKIERHDTGIIIGVVSIFAAIITWSYNRFENLSFVYLGVLIGIGISMIIYSCYLNIQYAKIGKPMRRMNESKEKSVSNN